VLSREGHGPARRAARDGGHRLVCLDHRPDVLGDLAAIQAFIKRRNLKVIVFDPAYTSLLKGNGREGGAAAGYR